MDMVYDEYDLMIVPYFRRSRQILLSTNKRNGELKPYDKINKYFLWA